MRTTLSPEAGAAEASPESAGAAAESEAGAELAPLGLLEHPAKAITTNKQASDRAISFLIGTESSFFFLMAQQDNVLF